MTKPTHTVVWNADKTEGFVTIDRQLAYEVRKSADTNCYDADGRRSDVGIAFCEAWGDQDCTMEPLVNSDELNSEISRLRAIISEVHSWIVCHPITTSFDMMQNAKRIEQITNPEFKD